jgi:hypothetical protein
MQYRKKELLVEESDKLKQIQDFRWELQPKK